MRALVATLFLAYAAVAQVPIDPERLAPELRNFQPKANEQKLACSVLPMRPRLNFGFRFQSGYGVYVPVRQLAGKGHWLAIVMRVTPRGEGGQPVYMAARLPLPEIPEGIKAELEFGGGYILGAGEYDVDWMMWDDRERVCRKAWRIEAKLSRRDRGVELAIPPNTVRPFGMRTVERKPEELKPWKVTVMLHAAPLFSRSTRLRPGDRVMLLGTLASLLERLPAQDVRLIVFSIDKQRELLRRDRIGDNPLQEVAQAMDSLELGTVDIDTLNNRRGHVDLLADLINGEIEAKEPADAVVFLGPSSRTYDKFPESMIETRNPAKPQFFYIRVMPYWYRGAEFADTITNAVKRLKGRTSLIRTPGEFARAIEEIEEKLSSSAPR